MKQDSIHKETIRMFGRALLNENIIINLCKELNKHKGGKIKSRMSLKKQDQNAKMKTYTGTYNIFLT